VRHYSGEVAAGHVVAGRGRFGHALNQVIGRKARHLSGPLGPGRVHHEQGDTVLEKVGLDKECDNMALMLVQDRAVGSCGLH